MKTIIAGTHTMTHYPLLLNALDRCPWRGEITEVVSGKAPGVDTLGEWWARSRELPIAPFPADWDQYGRAAGPIRNAAMEAYAKALIAVWDGQSPGTRDMCRKMHTAGKPMLVYDYRKQQVVYLRWEDR